jgi:hypothetical protein
MRQFRFSEAITYTVKKLVTTKDELSGEIEDWQNAGTIQAEVWPLLGNQTRGVMGVTEKSTHRAFSTDPKAFTSNTRIVDSAGLTYLVGYVPPQGYGSHGEAVLEFVNS